MGAQPPSGAGCRCGGTQRQPLVGASCECVYSVQNMLQCVPPAQDHQQLPRVVLDDDDIGRIEEVLLEGRRIRGDVYNFERRDWAVES